MAKGAQTALNFKLQSCFVIQCQFDTLRDAVSFSFVYFYGNGRGSGGSLCKDCEGSGCGSGSREDTSNGAGGVGGGGSSGSGSGGGTILLALARNSARGRHDLIVRHGAILLRGGGLDLIVRHGAVLLRGGGLNFIVRHGAVLLGLGGVPLSLIVGHLRLGGLHVIVGWLRGLVGVAILLGAGRLALIVGVAAGGSTVVRAVLLAVIADIAGIEDVPVGGTGIASGHGVTACRVQLAEEVATSIRAVRQLA
mmetsp:Transcript_8274/g.24738  ORF Transcript_8274/g.24738 Transcript_8274/m.24738 type:complete len:251 (-) Transcript_8274:1895-2647(-)